MLLLQRSQEKNYFNFFLFWLSYLKESSGHNEISFENFFSSKNFKRIYNGPNFTTISTIAAREIFKKIWKSVYYCDQIERWILLLLLKSLLIVPIA